MPREGSGASLRLGADRAANAEAIPGGTRWGTRNTDFRQARGRDANKAEVPLASSGRGKRQFSEITHGGRRTAETGAEERLPFDHLGRMMYGAGEQYADVSGARTFRIIGPALSHLHLHDFPITRHIDPFGPSPPGNPQSGLGP